MDVVARPFFFAFTTDTYDSASNLSGIVLFIIIPKFVAALCHMVCESDKCAHLLPVRYGDVRSHEPIGHCYLSTAQDIAPLPLQEGHTISDCKYKQNKL